MMASDRTSDCSSDRRPDRSSDRTPDRTPDRASDRLPGCSPHATVYFHGQPGSARELALFGAVIAERTDDWLVLDRAEALAVGAQPYLAELAQRASVFAAGRPLRLIGFSIGGSIALRVAAMLGSAVAAVDLVSTAAPSANGLFPEAMAGKPVFTLAAKHPRLFHILTAGQGIIARVAPTFLTKQVFASAAGGDALLAADPQFRRQIAPLLRDSLTRGSAVYRADVSSYATTHIDAYLDQITSLTAPVTFWHGSMDNWAPIEMAAALAQRLPGATVHIEPGASHYSTLAAFLAQV